MALDNQNGANEPIRWRSSYNSSMFTLPANAILTVFTPGANLNGAVIHSVRESCYNTNAASLVPLTNMLIKTGAAPASATDGIILAYSVINAGYENGYWMANGSIVIDQPLYIEPGYGLYFANAHNSIQGLANKSVLYTLL